MFNEIEGYTTGNKDASTWKWFYLSMMERYYSSLADDDDDDDCVENISNSIYYFYCP